MELLCKSSGQICPHISQASIGSDSELLTVDSVILRALLLFNTGTPTCLNKIIHLRAPTKVASKICLNTNAKYSFKQMHLDDADAMSGTELIPDLSVIVHGWIVKGGLVLVKEIFDG